MSSNTPSESRTISRRTFLRNAVASAPLIAAAPVFPLQAAPDQKRSVQVESIPELRTAMQRSNQNVRMKPGTYTVKDTLDDDVTTFRCSGSNNVFDLRDVTIEVPTEVLNNMPNRGAHALGSWRIEGDRNVFGGGTFRNTGDNAPRRSLSEFSITGDENRFFNCKFLVKGSSPYGYGDMYGKGSGSAVPTRKHSAMAINGDRNVVENCQFQHRAFGHGIHMHNNAKKTHLRNVQLTGKMRLTDEIYQEEEGPAAKFDYKQKFPKWEKDDPIPKGEMIALTEDGIRSYGSKNTVVENCTVRKMRGGIAMAQGKNTTVKDTTILDCSYGFSPSTGATVESCRGNASVGPLLRPHYNNRHSTNLDLELLHSEKEYGDHRLASVIGSNHEIQITYNGPTPDTKRPILVGWAWGNLNEGRWARDHTPDDQLSNHHSASNVKLVNDTPHPVILTEFSSGCTIKSKGPVRDNGKKNKIIS